LPPDRRRHRPIRRRIRCGLTDTIPPFDIWRGCASSRRCCWPCWRRDGRGAGRATNAYENDLFLAARLALNDVESTEFTVSLVEDLARSGRVLGFEAKRRLNDRLSLKLEGIAFAGIGREGNILSDLRRDGFVALNLVYGF